MLQNFFPVQGIPDVRVYQYRFIFKPDNITDADAGPDIINQKKWFAFRFKPGSYFFLCGRVGNLSQAVIYHFHFVGTGGPTEDRACGKQYDNNQ